MPLPCGYCEKKGPVKQIGTERGLKVMQCQNCLAEWKEV